jgi:hypothetical protein
MHKFTPHNKEAIKRLHHNGKSQKDIAHIMGLHSHGIKALHDIMVEMALIFVADKPAVKVKAYIQTDAEKNPDEYLADKFTGTRDGRGGFARNNMAADRYAHIAATKHMTGDY